MRPSHLKVGQLARRLSEGQARLQYLLCAVAVLERRPRLFDYWGMNKIVLWSDRCVRKRSSISCTSTHHFTAIHESSPLARIRLPALDALEKLHSETARLIEHHSQGDRSL